jgi:two-component system phosphate regulon response regulator PhoB
MFACFHYGVKQLLLACDRNKKARGLCPRIEAMSKKHILIIEDDEDIQQLVSFNLIKSGFNASCADSGEEGLERLETEIIDCVLLDIMLPGISGIEVCKKIREQQGLARLPIIMMSAKRQEAEIIAGLENGADDYITKPFSPRVLVARLKSVLRRSRSTDDAGQETAAAEVISAGALQITPGRHEVLVHGRAAALTSTEFAILVLLARRPGWVFSRQQIIDAIRGHDYIVTPRMIDVQIFSLRKKLAAAGENIETVRGIGYRYRA